MSDSKDTVAQDLVREILSSPSDEHAAALLMARVAKEPVVMAIQVLSRTIGQLIPYLRATVRIDDGDIQMALPPGQSDAAAMALALSLLDEERSSDKLLDRPSQFHRLQIALGAADCLAGYVRGLGAQPTTAPLLDHFREQLRFGIDASATINALNTDITPQ